MRFWSGLATVDLAMDPSLEIKCISSSYANYLGDKLSELYFKLETADQALLWQISSSCVLLSDVFASKTMSELLAIYYRLMNHPGFWAEVDEDERRVTESLEEMFKVLERDFARTNNEALYSVASTGDNSRQL